MIIQRFLKQLSKLKCIFYLPLKNGMVREAGALNLILKRLLDIMTKTIIVTKYGAILKKGDAIGVFIVCK